MSVTPQPDDGAHTPEEWPVIAGASGYGCELVVACRVVGRDSAGLVDDGEPNKARIEACGSRLLGTLAEAASWSSTFLAGAGYPVPRRAITQRLLDLGLVPAPALIHPSSVLMGAAPVPDGTVLFPNTTISNGAVLGASVLINYNASIGHDTVLGSFSTVSPGAQIGGECVIGSGVLIGSGAVVLQGLRIGDGATVGSGAVVTKDVGEGETVIGVPAAAR